MVPLEKVPLWWTLDGVGHALHCYTPKCRCGHCPRYAAACGLKSNEGEHGPIRPNRVCSECRRVLASSLAQPIEGRVRP